MAAIRRQEDRQEFLCDRTTIHRRPREQTNLKRLAFLCSPLQNGAVNGFDRVDSLRLLALVRVRNRSDQQPIANECK